MKEVSVTQRFMRHAQLGIIHQCLGHGTQVMGCPDHHRFFIHQTDDGQLSYIAHQLLCLLAGIPAGNAWLDAEQGMGLVFALEEGGFADSELGVVCGHRFLS